jgi:hypothetical protein
VSSASAGRSRAGGGAAVDGSAPCGSSDELDDGSASLQGM